MTDAAKMVTATAADREDAPQHSFVRAVTVRRWQMQHWYVIRVHELPSLCPARATDHDVTTSSSSMVIVVVLDTSVVSVPPSPVLAVQVTSQCVVAVTV